MFVFVTPTKVFAGTDLYLIQTAVNDRTWTIEGAVVKDTIGWTGKIPLEGQRFGNSIDALTATPSIVGDSGIMDLIDSATPNTTKGGSAQSNLPLTFPGALEQNFLGITTTVTAGDADRSRATAVLNALLYDFKIAFDLAYPDRSSWTFENFVDKVQIFLAQVGAPLSGSGPRTIEIEGGGRVIFTSVSSGGLPSDYTKYDKTSDDTDYVKMKVISTDGRIVDYHFMYRMVKGYNTTGLSGTRDFSGLGLITDSGVVDDVNYVNWDMLVAEAVLGYCLESSHQVTVSNIGEGTLTSFESALVNAAILFHQNIVSMLNLWPIEQLVFNQGLRSTQAYSAGVFQASWEGVIWGLFMVSELLAIILLFWILIQTCAQRALSTMNVMGRLSTWERLKQVILAAIILALLPLLIQLLMQLSAGLTQVIVAAFEGGTYGASMDDVRASVTGSTGQLGTVIASFLLIGIDCYFNFLYTLRGLTVAMLIITGPLFVVLSISSNPQNNPLKSWLNQLLSNIFTQPIHAFAFTLVLALPTSPRSFENLLMLFATIPFSLSVKKLFFKDGGTFGEDVAGQAKAESTGGMKMMAGAVGGAVVGAVGGTIGGAFSKDDSSSSYSGVSGAGGRASAGKAGGAGGGNAWAGGSAGAGTYNSKLSDSQAESRLAKTNSSSSSNSSTASARASGGAVTASTTPTSGSSSGSTDGTSGPLGVTDKGEKVSKMKSALDKADQKLNEATISNPDKNTKMQELDKTLYEATTSKKVTDPYREKPKSKDTEEGAKRVATAKTLGRTALGAGLSATQIAGGVAMATAGGGLSAIGLGGVGNAITNTGKNIASSGGTRAGRGIRSGVRAVGSKMSDGKEEKKNKESFFNKSNLPFEASTGKLSEANPVFQNGSSSYNQSANKTTTFLDRDNLADAGITNMSKSGEGSTGYVNYSVDGSTPYGQEIAAYSNYLSSFSDTDEGRARRSAEVERTGMDVTPIQKAGQNTGSYSVAINATKFNENTGMSVKNDKQGNLTITNEGREAGNLIPQVKAEKTRTTIEKAKDGSTDKETSTSESYNVKPSEALRIQNAEASGNNKVKHRTEGGSSFVSIPTPTPVATTNVSGESSGQDDPSHEKRGGGRSKGKSVENIVNQTTSNNESAENTSAQSTTSTRAPKVKTNSDSSQDPDSKKTLNQ